MMIIDDERNSVGNIGEDQDGGEDLKLLNNNSKS
jgi:hypothetical protein